MYASTQDGIQVKIITLVRIIWVCVRAGEQHYLDTDFLTVCCDRRIIKVNKSMSQSICLHV